MEPVGPAGNAAFLSSCAVEAHTEISHASEPSLGLTGEVYPEVEEGEGSRLDMLLFASPLSEPPNEDETPEANPGRLVRLAAGGRYDAVGTRRHFALPLAG